MLVDELIGSASRSIPRAWSRAPSPTCYSLQGCFWSFASTASLFRQAVAAYYLCTHRLFDPAATRSDASAFLAVYDAYASRILAYTLEIVCSIDALSLLVPSPSCPAPDSPTMPLALGPVGTSMVDNMLDCPNRRILLVESIPAAAPVA